VTDADSDQLFEMGNITSDANEKVETFYRTQKLNVVSGNSEDLADNTSASSDGNANNPDLDVLPPQAGAAPEAGAACENVANDDPGDDSVINDGCPTTRGALDSDSDNDGLQDGVEVRFYGTYPSNRDSDGDGCDDGKEAADVNGDRIVNSADLSAVANTPTPIFGIYRDGDGSADLGVAGRFNYDFNRDGVVNSADLSGVAGRILNGVCLSPQGGKTIGAQMKVDDE
jgi:hypothetical protein